MPGITSATSTAYDRWALTTSADPTALPVFLAYVAVGADPATADWRAASWETPAAGATEYVVRLTQKIGPIGVRLAVGAWEVWVDIDGERAPIGTLSVY